MTKKETLKRVEQILKDNQIAFSSRTELLEYLIIYSIAQQDLLIELKNIKS